MADRKSTRLNSSHTEIYTLSLHDALPISFMRALRIDNFVGMLSSEIATWCIIVVAATVLNAHGRSEEHTSELQSHRDLHSFPTRRSSDLIHARTPYR